VADEGLTDLRFLDYDSDDEDGFDETESGDNEPDKKKVTNFYCTLSSRNLILTH
jgi:hypothetical protein